MNLLVIRCLNGVVVWAISPNARNNTKQAVCLNDGTVVPLVLSPTSIVSGLTSVAAHSITLHGTIQQALQLML